MSLTRARELRLSSTTAERRFWALLEPLRKQGYHFRRQVPIGPYYADFACHHAKLVIEVDGATHSTDAELAHDARRDRYLHSRGFQVLRFWNSDVVTNPVGVGDAILAALVGQPMLKPAPTPHPKTKPRLRKVRTGLKDLAARTGQATPAPPSPLRGGAGGGGGTRRTESGST